VRLELAGAGAALLQDCLREDEPPDPHQELFHLGHRESFLRGFLGKRTMTL
jgi:hypothetical protein